MKADEIKQLVERELVGSEAHVTGDDITNFKVIVVGDVFVNKTRVQQQQLVYRALSGNIVNGDIHALELKTYTQKTWDER